MHSLFDLLLHITLISAENPNSHRCAVENCNKIFNALLAIKGYFSLMEIQTDQWTLPYA